MHAEELRSAITRLVEVLNKADILAVVKEYRTAQGDNRAVAAARLGHSGAVIMESMEHFSTAEKAVAKCMFLDNLGTTQYWQGLLASVNDPKKNAAELVHLFSRVMFASTHLPNLAKLLGESGTSADHAAIGMAPPATGEGRLTIRLTDAGEKASDPDRIARSIDGIDMLYSACASIARKPAMDLRLDGINGGAARDLHFMGERDSVAAVSAVIGSIPEALADLNPDDDDLDLDALVASLPIFQDLNTLATLGTFTQTDLKDISETMHQGGMLILESGVILVDDFATSDDLPTQEYTNSVQMRPGASTATAPEGSAPTSLNGHTPSKPEPAERDEHYERYLRERAAMQRSEANGSAPTAVGSNNSIGHISMASNRAKPNGIAAPDDDQSSVPPEEELLKNIGRSRDR